MTKQKRKSKPNQYKHRIWIGVIVAIAIVIVTYTLNQTTNDDNEYSRDVIIYQPRSSLILFDPQTQTQREIFEAAPAPIGNYFGTPQGDTYVSQRNNQFATQFPDATGQDIFVFNIHDETPLPTNITHTPETPESLVGWNSDYTQLAYITGDETYQLYVYMDDQQVLIDDAIHFVTYGEARLLHSGVEWRDDDLYYITSEGETTQIRAWDGEHIRNLASFDTFTEAEALQIFWYTDEQFSLNVWYDVPYNIIVPNPYTGNSYTYVWQNNRLYTVPNPLNHPYSTSAGWNNRGELALITRNEHGETGTFIWDGQPDTWSFIAIGNELGSVWRMSWDHLDRLRIHALSQEERFQGYYTWQDGTSTLIREMAFEGGDIIDIDHSEHELTALRLGGFFTYSLEVYAPDGSLRHQDRSRSNSLWGANGHLAYCDGEYRLAVWDGGQPHYHEHNSNMVYQWVVGSDGIRRGFCGSG